ncbi:dephospho-CoA kinase [Cellulomonas edaphi]|uniref:Dephospho-CoA kinase n=1 Tax=Cellulomonas edaphi TaxID=3053468 RepID=A0ABT7S624_9CELL|nr:dephospho-CoA kinase [Cellulomons edaphi]MDM7831075.1 dephospho-CoA kinase [Cellulomons edaphi]
MQRIGLTGGIASGKSVVATRLAELGAVVIDSDVLARQALAPGSAGLDAVVEAFGPGVLAEDGSLDRAALAGRVFADDEERARLNAIVHPIVRRLSAEREAAAAVADHGAIVVHDIPLLVETGRADAFHVLVVVQAPADERARRLVEGRGLTRAEAEARIAAQATDEQRLAVADVVLDGSGSVDGLRAHVDELWSRLSAESADEVAAETP